MQFTFPFQGVLPPGVMSFARWLARLVRRLLVRRLLPRRWPQLVGLKQPRVVIGKQFQVLAMMP